MKQLLKRILIRIRNRDKSIVIRDGANIGWNSSFEGCNYIGRRTSFDGHIGFGSYIASDSSINAKIGKYCCISRNVKTLQGLHPTSKYISIHPAFFSDRSLSNFTFQNKQIYNEIKHYADENYDVLIENDVWIGESATILPGVKIGNGAIVAANATVTKDVPEYAIVAGTPARVIKYRFDKEEIEILLSSEWWDLDEISLRSIISENPDIVTDVSAFVKRVSVEKGEQKNAK